jgi:hypothetical protein
VNHSIALRWLAGNFSLVLLGACSARPNQVETVDRFDPPRVVVGDTILGLRVSRLEVHAVPDRPGEWVGSVDFEGSVTLSGTYRPHFAYPEPDLQCLYPDKASASKLPRFPEDERVSCFCFSNQDEARRLLRPSPDTGAATLVIEAFRYAYSFSDVFNPGKLSTVIRHAPGDRMGR